MPGNAQREGQCQCYPEFLPWGSLSAVCYWIQCWRLLAEIQSAAFLAMVAPELPTETPPDRRKFVLIEGGKN